MPRLAWITIAGVFLVGACQSAAGVVVGVAEDFEGYSSTAEMNSVWNSVPVGTGVLSSSDGHGNTLFHLGGSAQKRTIAAMTPSDAAPIIWEFDMFDDGTHGGVAGKRVTGGLRNSALGAILEMGRYNAAVDPPAGFVSGYAVRATLVGASTDWLTFSPNLPVEAGWHHMRATIRASNILFEFDRGDDGSVDASRTVFTATGGGGVYNQVRFGGPSDISSGGGLSFDNLVLRQVPEPPAMIQALLCSSAATCALRCVRSAACDRGAPRAGRATTVW